MVSYVSGVSVPALILSPTYAKVSSCSYQLIGLRGAAHTSHLTASLFGISGRARASQLTAGLTGISGRARVTLLAIQAIVRPKMPPPIYPTLLVGYSVIKRPKFFTVSAAAASGREVRYATAQNPLWEWDLTYEYLPDVPAHGITPSDLKTMLGFYLAVSGGLLGFCFDDPDDDAVTGQVLGTTDGTSTQWQLIRTYGGSDGTGTEPVGYVNTGKPFHVYLGGVLQDPGSYTLIQALPVNQLLRFNSVPAAGQVITVDMSYYYYVRFKDDTNDFEKFMDKLWTLKKVTLESLRG